jgi:hypothetical protein
MKPKCSFDLHLSKDGEHFFFFFFLPLVLRHLKKSVQADYTVAHTVILASQKAEMEGSWFQTRLDESSSQPIKKAGHGSMCLPSY